MYYIFGDIHGTFDRLVALCKKVIPLMGDDDILIFLGDYIDRGPCSYEVVEFLIGLSRDRNTIFLKGNHEDMFLRYLRREDYHDSFLANGGFATLASYRKSFGTVPPEHHMSFFNRLKLYYETADFIAVHAGMNPEYGAIENQPEMDTLWIREEFYRSRHEWGKTVIFGHTPLQYVTGRMDEVYFDEKRNIIGIDTGAVYGGMLTCLRMPDREVFQS